jgi:hypothetical protein
MNPSGLSKTRIAGEARRISSHAVGVNTQWELTDTTAAFVGLAYSFLTRRITCMATKVVRNQTEWDAIPAGFDGEIEIRLENGLSIVLDDGNAKKQAWVRAYDSSQVTVYDSSQVTAYGSSQVTAYGSSQVTAYDSSQVIACGLSQVTACDSSQVRAYDSSQVTACGSSQVRACDSSRVRACDSSQVTAYGSSQVIACGLSQVKAKANCQVLRLSDKARIKVSGNARIVTPPTTPQEYAEYYDLPISDGKITLYKAVTSDMGAFYDDGATRYNVGETKTHDCDPSPLVKCGIGLHVAHKDWAIEFGFDSAGGDSFKLLECSVPLDKLVVPKYGDGKVRCSELTVIREVPRSEW